MKVYAVTEVYTTTRVLKVLAPDEEAAKNWNIHPSTMVLDYGTLDEHDREITAVEQPRRETK